MASIEHTLPPITPREGSSFGYTNPTIVVTEFETGPRTSRSWVEYPVRSYDWQFPIARLTSNTQALLDAFLSQVSLAGSCFWVPEPVSFVHPKLVIGPLADGSRTSFVVPCQSVSDEVVFIDDDRTVAYTLHSVANLLTDAQANAVGGTTGMQVVGTASLTSFSAPTVDGITSFKVHANPAPAGNIGLETTSAGRPTVSASQQYTIMCAAYTEGDVYLEGQFYQSDNSTPEGAAFTDSATCSWGNWQILTASATSGAAAARLNVKMYRTTSSSASVWFGAIGVCPGDLDRWFLPSTAPAVIEFDTAPADRSRITMFATGYRFSRVRMKSLDYQYVVHGTGNYTPGALRMVEEIES